VVGRTALLPLPARQVARRKPPYLFSSAELQALEERGRLWTIRSLRPISFQTIIGLLSSTGLRAGEALRLQVKDLALSAKPPYLVIRETNVSQISHRSTSSLLRCASAELTCRA
jgi:integrase